MQLSIQSKMLIKVKILTGREDELDIEPNYKVMQIKEILCELLGYTRDQKTRLIHKRTQMDDEKTAQDYNLSEGSVLYFVLVVRA